MQKFVFRCATANRFAFRTMYEMPRYSSTVHGGGDGTQSRQEARLGLQPLTDYAGTSFTIGLPSLRKDVIDDSQPTAISPIAQED